MDLVGPTCGSAELMPMSWPMPRSSAALPSSWAEIAGLGPYVFDPDGGEDGEACGVRSGDSKPPAREFQKWNPVWWFGNADDPVPPEWYRPGSPNRGWLWQLRNPLHNFTFYVIGIADKPFTRGGRFPEDVFARDGGWNWAVAKHRWLRLPFISYNGERWRFYFGWRERGNFGGKINIGRLPPADL